jgi:hypothetical protein
MSRAAPVDALPDPVCGGRAPDVNDLWSRLVDVREMTGYYEALLYADAHILGMQYHELTEALREAYELRLVQLLSGMQSDHTSRARPSARTLRRSSPRRLRESTEPVKAIWKR